MKKVLIIGAGFLQSFVIRRAKELGYETYAVDGDTNAVGFCHADKHEVIDIVDEEACLAYARKENIDGVLTAATDYGVLTAAYIAKKMHLPGLDYEVAKLVKNKYKVRKCLFEAKVDDTEQAYEVDESTDISALCEKLSFPVMVKPCDGSGSRGASRVDRKEDFAGACRYAVEGSITKRAEVETFIVGEEYGVESFVENGHVHILAVMKKTMTKPPYYAELGHAYPCGLPAAAEEKIKGCVKKALSALGVNFGSVNMDLLVTAKGNVHIVDIGARMGGNLIGSHIVPLAAGVDYMGNMIKAAVGDETDFKSPFQKAVATRLLALKPGTVSELPDFEKIRNDYGVIIEHHLHIGDEITTYRTNLDGCGYVVAGGDERNSCEEKAETVRELIDNLIKRV